MFGFLDRLDQSEDVEEIRQRLNSFEQDLDELVNIALDNQEDVEALEKDTKSLRKVVSELQEEIADEDEVVELEGMEQEIFKILMRAEKPLTNSDIGAEMEEPKEGRQVRPKINSLKKKVAEIVESKDGRAKAYEIPQTVKTEYLEKGTISNKH